jgi:hypothetical protein
MASVRSLPGHRGSDMVLRAEVSRALISSLRSHRDAMRRAELDRLSSIGEASAVAFLDRRTSLTLCQKRALLTEPGEKQS